MHAAHEEAPVEPPVLAEPPVPDVEASPTLSEIERRRAEAETLEEVGRSLELSLTQQLDQMAAEAGPSMLGGEDTARRKLMTDHGKQGSPEGIPEGQKSEEALEVLARDSSPL